VVTDRVCREDNSFLGSHIDAPLIEFLPIQSRRAELGLAGHSGRVPSPLEMLLGGNQEIIGEDGGVRRAQALLDEATGKIAHRVFHHSKDIQLPDGNKAKQISVDVRDRDEIPKIIARERKRHNLPPLSDEDMAAELAKLTVKTVVNPVVKLNISVNFSMLRHAMFKMAYEFAFIWLGEDYLDDPLAAALRKAILDKDPHATDALAGYVGWAANFAPFHFWNPHPAHHLAYGSAQQNSVFVMVRVFDIWAIGIPVSHNAARYLKTRADEDKLRFMALDAPSPRIVDTPFWQETRRIAGEMTRLGRKPPFPDPLEPLASE
jgi:hypothetical protein